MESYPDYAAAVAAQGASGAVGKGILLCSSAVGMSIAASKINGIRTALGTSIKYNGYVCKHNDGNIPALSAKYKEDATAQHMVQAFVSTAFKGGRHARRVAKIQALENFQKGQ